MSIGPDVEVRFRGTNRSVLASARGSQDAIRATERTAVEANQRISRSTSAMTANQRRGLASLRSEVSSVSSAIGSITARGATRAAQGISLVTGAVSTLAVVSGFRFASMKEQATIAFETMIGDGARARQFLDQLAGFAARTPFEFPDLVMGTQRLMAMGFSAKEVLPTMTAIGNAVSAMGGGAEMIGRVTRAFGQIRARGRLAAEEMLQLTEAGIPAWRYLAETLNVSVAKAMKLVEKRTVDSGTALRALVSGMNRDFPNMMAKQSRTLQGLWSTFKDTFSMIAAEVLAPFYAEAKRGLEDSLGVMGSPRFKASIRALGQEFAASAIPAIRRFVGFVVDHFPEAIAFVREMAGHARTVARALEQMAAGAQRVVGAIGGWDDAFVLILTGVIAFRVARIAHAFGLIGPAATTAAAETTVATTAMSGSVNKTRGRVMALRAAWLLIPLAVLAAEVEIGRATGATSNWIEGTKNALRETANLFSGKDVDWSKLLTGDKGLIGSLFAGEKTAREAGLRAGQGYAAAFIGSAFPAIQAAFGASAAKGAAPRAPATQTASPRAGSVRPPVTSFPTHQTLNLPGFPATDIMAKQGTKVEAPEDGDLTRLSGKDPAAGSSPGGAGGLSLYYIGDSGTVYYMTHLQAVAPKGRYKAGDVIAIIGAHVSGSHVHVGRGRGAAAESIARAPSTQPPTLARPRGRPARPPTPFPETGTPAFPTEDPGDLDDGDKKKKKRTRTGPAKADPQDLRVARQTLAFIRRNVEEIVSPRLRARVRRQAAELAEELTHVVTAKDLTRFRKRLTDLRQLYDRGIDLNPAIKNVRRQVTALGKTINQLPEAARRDFAARLRKLGNAVSNAVSQKDIQNITDRLDRLREQVKRKLEKIREAAAEATQKALDAARDRVDQASSRFADAWGRMADKAMRIFDARTDEMVKAARAPFEAATAAEKALDELRKRREKVDIGRRREDVAGDLTTAQEDLATALRLGDPRMIREAQDRLRDLQREMEDIALDEQEAALETQADLERKAADAAADLAQKAIEDEREYARERFEARLDEIRKGLADEKLTAQQAQDAMIALLGEYGIDFQAAGTLVGSMFAQGFRDAMSDLNLAIQDLVNSINRLREATGQPPINLPPPVPRRPIRVPEYGSGGITTRPTLAIVGDNPNSREAIIPLDDPRARRMLGRGGDTYIVVNLPRYLGDKREVVEEIRSELIDATRRNVDPGF